MSDNVLFSDGRLIVNIRYLFDSLSDDDKRELARLSAYYNEQMIEIERYVMDEFAAPRVNSELLKLRIKFLTGDGADERAAAVIHSLTADRDRYEEAADTNSKRYWSLYHWVRSQGIEPPA